MLPWSLLLSANLNSYRRTSQCSLGSSTHVSKEKRTALFGWINDENLLIGGALASTGIAAVLIGVDSRRQDGYESFYMVIARFHLYTDEVFTLSYGRGQR